MSDILDVQTLSHGRRGISHESAQLVLLDNDDPTLSGAYEDSCEDEARRRYHKGDWSGSNMLDVLPPARGISTVAGAADYPPLKRRRGKAAVRAARAVTGGCTTGYRAYHGGARGSTSGGPD